MATAIEDISAACSAEPCAPERPEDPKVTSQNLSTQKKTSVPKLQLAIVLLVQFAEPITADVIYPFVNQFVRRTGITRGEEKATGYYAGIIESMFFLAEGATALAWQRASDRWGRRPLLVIGPLGLSIAMLAFGLSKSYWSLVLSRCFQGAFNGNIGISKTVMAEITDSTNRADVLATIPMMWSVGTTLSPFIGGVFSYPAKHWPDTFGKLAFFRENPFFLPCAIAAAIAFVGFLFGFAFLKETAPAILLKRKRARQQRSGSSESQLLLRDGPVDTDYGTLTSAEADEEEQNAKVPALKEVLTKSVISVLMNYGLFAFTDMCNFALQPLVWTTSIHNGGLGFDALTVGTINTAFGLPNAIFQLLALGKILRYFGPRRIAHASFIANFLYLIMYPLENYWARQAGYADWRVWTLIVIQLLLSSTIYCGYAALQLYLIDVSPTPGAVGTLQGLGQTAAVICRALSPPISTSLFALSTERNLLWGYFVFVFLALVDLLAIRSSWLLPKL